MEIKGMTTEEKYDSIIGMIEGCMEDNDSVVDTERLLESLLIDLTTKYPVFSLKDSSVTFHEYPVDERLMKLLVSNNKNIIT